MSTQEIEDGAQLSTESGKEGWGHQRTRRTVFQAEGKANAKAAKYEEYGSLGIGRIYGFGEQDRELRLETMQAAGRILEARNSWGKIPSLLGKGCMCMGSL